MSNTQLTLPRSSAAINSEDFAATLQSELLHLPTHRLPLENGLTMGSHVEAVQQVMLLGKNLTAQGYRVKIGVFFTSILAGCNCADDPTPQDTHNEYLEIELLLDPASTRATLT